MKYVISILLGCWVGTLFAQTPKAIQQLKKQIVTVSSDTTRSRLLVELGIQYEQTHLDSCFYFLNQSLQAAQRSQDPYAIARAMYRLSYTHLYLTRDDSQALKWANMGIAVAKPAKDYLHLAKIYLLLSILSTHQGTGSMEEMSKQSLLYAQKSNSWQVLGESYGLISDSYLTFKNYKQAEIMVEKAMRVFEKHDLDSWVTYGIDYADLLKKNGKPEQAKLIYQKLASMKDKLPKSQGEWIYLNDIAKVETELKNYTVAERLLLKGVTKEHQKAKADTLHLYYFYQSLTSLYVAKHDYKKAYESGMTLAEIRQWLKDKRQTQDSKLQMTQLEAKLNLEKKEAEIALLAEQKKEQQLLLMAASIIGVLLIGFVVVLQRNRRRIERQRAELVSLNTTKDKLFAILSHDLRAPVKSLGSYFMLINWGALSQSEFVESVQSLNTQLSNVHDMLDNVLNWAMSQLGGMRPQKEKIAIAPVIEEQMQLLMPVAQAKGIQLTQQVLSETQLTVDKNHLGVMVRNLLHNAIKFTHSGGKICLTQYEKDGWEYIEVKDTGVGMSEERLQRLFQLEKESSQTGTAHERGTGLGLVLVKELVEVNGGTIEVSSEVNKGTTFVIGFKK
jgi:signal transduction histidine kinase